MSPSPVIGGKGFGVALHLLESDGTLNTLDGIFDTRVRAVRNIDKEIWEAESIGYYPIEKFREVT